MTLQPAPRPMGNGKTLAAAAVAALLGGVIGYTAPQILRLGSAPAASPSADEVRLEPSMAEPAADAPPPQERAALEPLPAAPVETAPVPDTPAPRAQETDEPAPERSAAADELEAQPTEPVRRGRARPSFNCRYAKSETERMICSEPDLAQVDRRLHDVFEEAMSQSQNPRRLRRQQDRWLAERESLGDDADAVLGHYENRIDELQGM